MSGAPLLALAARRGAGAFPALGRALTAAAAEDLVPATVNGVEVRVPPVLWTGTGTSLVITIPAPPGPPGPPPRVVPGSPPALPRAPGAPPPAPRPWGFPRARGLGQAEGEGRKGGRKRVSGGLTGPGARE